MHHSEREESEEIRRLMADMKNPLGATGKYPKGKLTTHDEGAIRLAVGVTRSGKVVLYFGKATAWIGMDAAQALALADSLRSKAHAVMARNKEADGKRKTVCVDMDAVLAHYDGWKGPGHIGDPRPGAVGFTRELAKFARVVVFTTRCKADFEDRPEGATPESLAAFVREWLDRHGFAYDEVYAGQGKPIYAALVDDRAVGIRANPEHADFDAALDAVRVLC